MHEFLAELGSGLALGAVAWLFGTTMGTRNRLNVHEKVCGQRYEEIATNFSRGEQQFAEIKNMLAAQNVDATARTITLEEIKRSVAVLDENRRVRELIEHGNGSKV